MKHLSNADLTTLHMRRAFLRGFIENAILQTRTANDSDSWERLRDQINAIREEIRSIVSDSKFDSLVSKAVTSHPSKGTYSRSGTITNAIVSAKELLVYVETIMELNGGPKVSDLRAGRARGGRVFVGHGHNEVVRYKVRDFIANRCSLEPIILTDLPSEGMSVIEKLERYGRTADFAILIMTADDITSDGQARARQNVIQEVGWFQGVLGRARTAILRHENIEFPSNLSGIIDFRFEGEAVEMRFEELRRELEQAGLL